MKSKSYKRSSPSPSTPPLRRPAGQLLNVYAAYFWPSCVQLEARQSCSCPSAAVQEAGWSAAASNHVITSSSSIFCFFFFFFYIAIFAFDCFCFCVSFFVLFFVDFCFCLLNLLSATPRPKPNCLSRIVQALKANIVCPRQYTHSPLSLSLPLAHALSHCGSECV